MQFVYGSFIHDENECWIKSITREAVRTERGLIRSLLVTVQFGIRIVAATQAALTTAMLARMTAYSVGRHDLTVYDNSGAATVFVLPDAGSISGVQVLRPPEFQNVDGAQYATALEATVTLQAEYPNAEPGAEIIDFREALTFSGGLPVRVFLQCTNTPPQEQVVSPQSTFDVVQQGYLRTLTPMPSPMAPLWPAALTDRAITPVSPRVQQFTPVEYEISWAYQFRSVTALTGLPNVL